MKKAVTRNISISIIIVLVFLMFFTAEPFSVDAATITLYPKTYTYVKHAPYWTTTQHDEFDATQKVKILERDYEYFYIEYTRGGQVRRGYVLMSYFDSADYAGYSWCNHTYFTPAKNKTGGTVTTYMGPSANYPVAGSIDSDEGISALKPLTLLRYEGDFAFVQYVTNPSSSGHAVYKRAWVPKNSISTVFRDAGIFASDSYAIIYNVGTGTALQLDVTDSSSVASIDTLTGFVDEHIRLKRTGTTVTGYSYKIINAETGKALEVQDKIPVVNKLTVFVTESSPNKAQEFYFVPNSDGTYQIQTRCSGGYMVLQAYSTGTNVSQEKPSNSVYQKWKVDVFNKYYPFYYPNATTIDGVTNVEYYVKLTGDNAIGNADVTSSLILDAVDYWNDYKQITGISLSRTYDSVSADFHIISGDTGDAYGQYEVSYGEYDFIATQGTLTLSSIWFPLLQTDMEKKAIICHELGHALSLYHPQEVGEYPKLKYYSIMNPGGDYIDDPKTVLAPQFFDYRMLACKWKGVPNEI